MTDDDVVEEPIYAALWRARLFLGCNILPLGLLTICSITCVPLTFATGNMWWLGVAIVLQLGGIAGLRRLASHDPDWWAGLWRHRKYARHYAAIGSIYAQYPPVRRHQR